MKIKNKEFNEFYAKEMISMLAEVDSIERLTMECFRRELCALLRAYELKYNAAKDERHKKQIIETAAYEKIISTLKSYFR